MNIVSQKSCQPVCLLQAGVNHTVNPIRAVFKGKTLTVNPTVVISSYNMSDSVMVLPRTVGKSFARSNFWKLTQITLQFWQASDIHVQQRQVVFFSAGVDLLNSCPFDCWSWLCKVIQSPVIWCQSVSYSCCAGTADSTSWSAEAWSGPRSLYGNFSQEFFLFKWPRYKSLEMALDNGNADSTVAVVTVALLWLCEQRIDCCQ